MKITLFAIGKTVKPYLREGLEIYENRLCHYVTYIRRELPDVKNAANLTEEQIKTQEGKLLLQQLTDNDELYLFDETGSLFSSDGLADFIRQKLNYSVKSLVLAIGGAYGFSEDVYKKSSGKISLSRMTFSHQMVRLIVSEQLYRAFTIIKGEPYHHR